MTGEAAPRYFAQARGQVVRFAPLLPDPQEWFGSIFDWDSHVAVVDLFSGAGGAQLRIRLRARYGSSRPNQNLTQHRSVHQGKQSQPGRRELRRH